MFWVIQQVENPEQWGVVSVHPTKVEAEAAAVETAKKSAGKFYVAKLVSQAKFDIKMENVA